jgi:NADH:ubiquinone oxidoreductase subunit F (NADH-binding)
VNKASSSLHVLLSLLLVVSPVYTAQAQQQSNSTDDQFRTKRVTVTGNVAAPQEFEVGYALRLFHVLAMVGGVRKGSKHIVRISHTDGTSVSLVIRNWQTDRKNCKINLYVKDGDTITVY